MKLSFKCAQVQNSFQRARLIASSKSGENSEVLTPLARMEFERRIGELFEGLQSEDPDKVNPILKYISDTVELIGSHVLFPALIDSGIFKLILGLANRPEYSELAVGIFCKMANKGEEAGFLVMKAGVLEFCQANIFSGTPEAEILIGQCLTGLIRSSIFTRAMIYSTGLLDALIGALTSAHTNYVDEIAAKILFAFISEGPTPGQEDPPSISKDTAVGMWQNAVETSTLGAICDWDRVAEFCTQGINFLNDSRYFQIIEVLLRSSWPPALADLLLAISTYLWRSKNARDDDTYRHFLDGPLCLFGHLRRLMDLRAVVVWANMMDAFASIYYCASRDPTVAAEEIVAAAFEIVTRFGEAPDINGAAICACNAITNIVSTKGFNDFVIENPENMVAIRRILYDGTFGESVAACWLFLAVINMSSFEDLSVDDVIKLNELLGAGDDELAMRILKMYTYLFLRQEKYGTESRCLFNVFEENNGFDVVFQLCESENKELAKKADDFITQFGD